MTNQNKNPKLTIDYHWKDFKKRVLPDTMSKDQLFQRQQLFYAGAEAMIRVNWELGGSELAEEEGADILESINVEIEAFSKKLIKKSLN